jgi:uncharacterized integral membrane protein
LFKAFESSEQILEDDSIMTYIKAVLLIALLFAAITFGIQNAESVTLRYYFGLASVPVPLYLVIYGSIILGILAGMAIDIYSRVTLRRRLKNLEKAKASLQDELAKIKRETGVETRERPESVAAEHRVTTTQPLPAPSAVPSENEKETETESMAPETEKD